MANFFTFLKALFKYLQTTYVKLQPNPIPFTCDLPFPINVLF
jgi:hypothetical protein